MHADFNEHGIPVFSLHSHDTHKCNCGDPECKAIGKHPRTSNWPSSPVWSEDQFAFMEEQGHFATGYGVVCKSLIVIDVDARNGGLEAYGRLIERFPEIQQCGFIVATGSGSGSKHLYFKAPEGVALLRHLKEFKGIDFQSGSSYVVGAGSLHASGNYYEVVSGSVSEIELAPQSLIEALTKPEYHRTEYNGQMMDVSHKDISDMVNAIPIASVDYENYIRIGMAIHHSLDGDGFDIFDGWASKSEHYTDNGYTEAKWHSFGRTSMPVTIGTLIYLAEQHGWRRSVEFENEQTSFKIDEPEATEEWLDTSDIDLRRPPEFAGELKEWIDSQCAHPVESLTLGATLYALGSIMGLRYTDDVTAVSTNMLVFNVAGSSVGKEAVLQSILKILNVAGLSGAVYGGIKSEQEITRNLITHQPSYYVIDEFGGQFAKVINSQKRGGAAYLEGLPFKLMEVFSKADGYYQVSGDMKADVRAVILKEIQSINKKIDNAGDGEDENLLKKRLATLEEGLKSVDDGIRHPFLSLIGFTTPETFEGLMDVGQATSGFLGRALLINELETNPRRKKDFKKTEMPEMLANKIKSLRYGGKFDVMENRIECNEEKLIIPTTDRAREFMEMAGDWIYEYAEAQKSTTRLEAVVRRGYEMMCKVSLAVAATGVRDLAHVRYGFAVAKWDMANKIRLVVSNDQTEQADKRLFASIERFLDKDAGVTFGVIKNKLRSYRPEDIQKAIDIMCDKKRIKSEQTTHGRNKTTVTKYFKA